MFLKSVVVGLVVSQFNKIFEGKMKKLFTKKKLKTYAKSVGVAMAGFSAVLLVLSMRKHVDKVPYVGSYVKDGMDTIANKVQGVL